MLYNAKGGIILIDNTETEYISFGKGDKNLIMIPGLGEGLRSIKGLALPMAYLYRMFSKDYRVYFLSRKNVMPQGYSTKDMADDIKKA
ncbi:MAG: alpha/beta hydrolase, partial [Oscillospiraceae bacterium]|nr:alpha/beta hydrolase [Oscillospiraceae bacterium]